MALIGMLERCIARHLPAAFVTTTDWFLSQPVDMIQTGWIISQKKKTSAFNQVESKQHWKVAWRNPVFACRLFWVGNWRLDSEQTKMSLWIAHVIVIAVCVQHTVVEKTRRKAQLYCGVNDESKLLQRWDAIKLSFDYFSSFMWHRQVQAWHWVENPFLWVAITEWRQPCCTSLTSWCRGAGKKKAPHSVISLQLSTFRS